MSKSWHVRFVKAVGQVVKSHCEKIVVPMSFRVPITLPMVPENGANTPFGYQKKLVKYLYQTTKVVVAVEMKMTIKMLPRDIYAIAVRLPPKS
jgi:hypothetical protein